MMLPRGKRDVKDVAKVMQHLFERNLASWDEDFGIFTKGFKPVKAKAPVRATLTPGSTAPDSSLTVP